MITLNEIKKFCPTAFANFPLKSLTTFKIGGNADFVAYPQSITELQDLLKFINKNKIEFFVLGNGSNVLASDKGYNGIIISTKKLTGIEKLSPCRISVLSGTAMSTVVRYACEHGLSGIEWSTGIPGTIGGAVIMNAGAYGGQISNVIESVTFIQNGEIKTLPKSQLFFEYRHSLFTNEKNCVIINAILKLKKDSAEDVALRVRDYTIRRASNQNVGYASAGSVFKRTNSVPPAKLIEDCGLKGLRIGDAIVSPVHSGFIVNLGKATANQVVALIHKIKESVYEKFKIKLECEIIFLRSKDEDF